MKTLKTLITAVLTLTIGAFSLSAQDLAPIYGTFPSVGATFPGSTTSNFTSVATYLGDVITLRHGNGIAIIPIVGCTNGSTAASGVGFKFDVSADNITWTTTMPLTNVVTMNGTNTIVGYTLFGPAVLDHVRYIRLAQIINLNTNTINPVVKFTYFTK